jgi:hypothetical protein
VHCTGSLFLPSQTEIIRLKTRKQLSRHRHEIASQILSFPGLPHITYGKLACSAGALKNDDNSLKTMRIRMEMRV